MTRFFTLDKFLVSTWMALRANIIFAQPSESSDAYRLLSEAFSSGNGSFGVWPLILISLWILLFLPSALYYLRRGRDGQGIIEGLFLKIKIRDEDHGSNEAFLRSVGPKQISFLSEQDYARNTAIVIEDVSNNELFKDRPTHFRVLHSAHIGDTGTTFEIVALAMSEPKSKGTSTSSQGRQT